MTDLYKTTVALDRSKLLGFDQESGSGTLPAAKIGPKNSPASTPRMPNAAKVGTKTVVTSVETANGFRSTADDLQSDAPLTALTFSTVGAPSIGLDWSHLLGFDQAAQATSFPSTNATMVGQKPVGPALRAKAGNKASRTIAALCAKIGSKDP
ncbi:MAG: hypothetical protein WD711_02725 [Dongiaceae bacterium]